MGGNTASYCSQGEREDRNGSMRERASEQEREKERGGDGRRRAAAPSTVQALGTGSPDRRRSRGSADLLGNEAL